MYSTLLPSIALGIGLSAAAGFRVFIPLLVAAVAGHFGWLPLTPGFAWLAGWPAIACFGTAALVEIGAYYIPVVDNMLDAINLPLVVAAGSLLATSVLPVDQELWKWVSGILIGGGSAGMIHLGTAFLRLGSTKLTAGTGNAALATAEHAASLGTSIMSLIVPVIAAVVILFLIVVLALRFLGSSKK